MPEPCRVRGILRSIEIDTVEVSVMGSFEPRSITSLAQPRAVVDFGPLGELRVDLHRLGAQVQVGDIFIAAVELEEPST